MEFVGDLLFNFIVQMLFSVGVIFVFGLILHYANILFVNILGYKGYKALIIVGAIGTPVHEFSHALMCLIFGHKITDMKLYQPNSEDGTLGYVNHSYNPKNVYHQIGNFFIGIAPIICGNAVLLLLMGLLLPDVFSGVVSEISSVDASFGGFFSLVFEVFGSVFAFSNFGTWQWWVFIILALMIASHMSLSTADIKGGVTGLLILGGIILAVDAVLCLISTSALEAVTDGFLAFSVYMASFLVLSVFFVLLMVLIAFAISRISALIARR